MKLRVWGLIGLLCVLPAVSVAGILSTTSITSHPNSDNQDWSLGWGFSVSGPVNVNYLGYNYFGVALNQSHTVGIFDSTGTLLASAIVDNSSTAFDGYLYTALGSTLTLGTGNYVIAGTTQGLDDAWIYQATGIVTSPGVTYLTSWFIDGAGGTLSFPTSEARDRQYLNVNFAETIGEVPEPATVSLLGAGLLSLMLVARRKSRA